MRPGCVSGFTVWTFKTERRYTFQNVGLLYKILSRNGWKSFWMRSNWVRGFSLSFYESVNFYRDRVLTYHPTLLLSWLGTGCSSKPRKARIFTGGVIRDLLIRIFFFLINFCSFSIAKVSRFSKFPISK